MKVFPNLSHFKHIIISTLVMIKHVDQCNNTCIYISDGMCYNIDSNI